MPSMAKLSRFRSLFTAIFAIAAGFALASLADLWPPARKSTVAAAEPLAAWHPVTRPAGYASFEALAVALAASARFSAQRFFVAAMIAFLPAAESFRLALGAAAGSDGAEGFLDPAHLLRCASAMRARAAALILRRLRFVGAGAAACVPPPDSIARRSLICESICLF